MKAASRNCQKILKKLDLDFHQVMHNRCEPINSQALQPQDHFCLQHNAVQIVRLDMFPSREKNIMSDRHVRNGKSFQEEGKQVYRDISGAGVVLEVEIPVID